VRSAHGVGTGYLMKEFLLGSGEICTGDTSQPRL